MQNTLIRVLLVSNFPADVELSRLTLEGSAGFEVLSVDRLEKAIAFLAHDKVDAVLLNLTLPDSSGLNTLFHLKEQIPATPILVISHQEDKELGIQVIQAGAQDFLVNFGRGRPSPSHSSNFAIERKRIDERLYYLATHDETTRLPNRIQFFDRLQHAIAFAERARFIEGKYSIAILILDLDRFRDVNESYGETVGDLVIGLVADRLRKILRKSDTIASLGGDKFALLLEGATASEGCGIVAEKILKDFSEPLLMNGFLLNLKTSIGVSRFPENGTDSISLYKNADTALIKAKQKLNCFVIAG
jgi:diguanylate cyclase (GGDEF)-like protein